MWTFSFFSDHMKRCKKKVIRMRMKIDTAVRIAMMVVDEESKDERMPAKK